MTPTTVKEALKDIVAHLPEECSWDEVMYQIYVRKKIEAGIHAADEGRVVPHDDVKKRFIKK